MKIIEKIKTMNDIVAIKTTNIVNTMWCTYAFVLLCFLPVIFTAWQNNILYLSNCLQLVFLPLILVAGNLLGKNAEDRAISDHKKLIKEFHLLKEENAKLQLILTKLEGIEAKISQNNG
jgi:hypothetical protein